MSSQSLAAEQLLELLLQLKKTTPAAARQILNAQPQIAYALITLMASMNAVNVDVCQKILSDYSASTGSIQPSLNPPAASSAPLSAIPPHVQSSSAPAPYRTSTPPTSHTPPISGPPASYPYSNGQPSSYGQPPPSAPPSYGGQPQGYGGGYSQNPYVQAGGAAGGGYPSSGYGSSSYGGPPQPPSAVLPDTLAGIPEDQKALIVRVISMTPEQLNALPPQERSMYIQIRSTLGIP
ncbi:hypothetical protein BDN72DRAFT_889301 [Pluteus cervinus]|uniref:Uncharacterized protein n=1 Tax=Pluteus cervinus TaxID=181527 RepID=A0ACD3AIZ8_9AGAR|nr:hypothetical protein BDN72DRAFT_889301 [Pluteus cervinus]